MSITVLADVILRNSVISGSVRGKSMRRNDRVVTDSGASAINIGWTKTLREYELGTVPMLVAAWQVVEGLYEITQGGAYGFLMEDPKDHAVASGEGVVALSGGIYQLQKRYITTGSSRYQDRAITRPRAAGFALTYNGVAATGYTLDATTGRITFVTPPADPTLLAWTGIFYVPVHFTEDTIDWDLIAPGAAPNRLLAGPSVNLSEIRE